MERVCRGIRKAGLLIKNKAHFLAARHFSDKYQFHKMEKALQPLLPPARSASRGEQFNRLPRSKETSAKKSFDFDDLSTTMIGGGDLKYIVI